LVLGPVFLLIWLNVSGETSEQPPARQNIILVILDSLRADRLGTAGYPREITPFLDQLTEKSVYFERAISPSSWTKTVMPSVLASLHPDSHGVRGINDVLAQEVLLLPEILKANGYSTACIHTIPWMTEDFGFNQGYDYFHYQRIEDGLNADRMNEQALQWIDQQAQEPFFLYLHYVDPHFPYDPSPSFKRFGDEPVDRYDGDILFTDAKIGELYAELERRGLLESTWLVISADHGEEFGEHGGIYHGRTAYQEVLHVPLIIHHPTLLASAKRVKTQVGLFDIAPTLLDLVGIPVAPGMEGASFASALLEPSIDLAEREIYSQVGLNDSAPGNNYLAISTPTQKYVVDLKNGKEELYFTEDDRLEQRNVAPENESTLREFRNRVSAYIQQRNEKRAQLVQEKRDLDPSTQERLKALGYLP
jgi:arylsulfatase A-like enzyme